MVCYISTFTHIEWYFLWSCVRTIFFNTAYNILDRNLLVEFSQIPLITNYPNIVRSFYILQIFPIMSAKPKTTKFGVKFDYFNSQFGIFAKASLNVFLIEIW